MLDFAKLAKGKYATFEQRVQGTLLVTFQGNQPKRFDVTINSTPDGFEASTLIANILKVKKDAGSFSWEEVKGKYRATGPTPEEAINNLIAQVELALGSC
ncbi:MAG: hypothetical protein PHC60_07640 [Heliobacteriaceae bacterium]|nr:hypothetical protein [Heliobacteriaceae bacterium]MDD4588242.1 hypothetical protein [Heliobacteriaceae bacterium]